MCSDHRSIDRQYNLAGEAEKLMDEIAKATQPPTSSSESVSTVSAEVHPSGRLCPSGR